VLALVVAGAGVRSLIGGLMLPAGDAGASREAESERVNRYALALENQVKQFDGRPLFFIPSEPTKPPPPPPARAEEGPPPPPPPPSKYGGPAIMGMYGGSVWFENGTWVKPGETSAAGVKVVRLDAPWSARLEWKGVEFDVPLFERDTIVSKPAGATPPPTPATPDGAGSAGLPAPKSPPESGPPQAGERADPTGDTAAAGETRPGAGPASPKETPPAPERTTAETPAPSSPEPPTHTEGDTSPGEDPRP
jgi:hypothetical protein